MREPKDNKIITNFIEKYGHTAFDNLLKDFLNEVSNQKIAEGLGVTRQRVHQWQLKFIDKKITLKEEVQKYLDKKIQK